MSIDRVRAYLKPLGLDGRILEFDTSSATVELAAQAAGVSSMALLALPQAGNTVSKRRREASR